MKILIAFLLLAGPALAADLAWDYDEYHEITTEFYLIYTDVDSYCSQKEAGQCSYEFPVEDALVEGEVVMLTDIYSKLNLHPGVEYTFRLARANDSGQSEYSNEVAHVRPIHQGPGTNLPPPVPSPPSGLGGLKIDE